jgi:hypothetical protein
MLSAPVECEVHLETHNFNTEEDLWLRETASTSNMGISS